MNDIAGKNQVPQRAKPALQVEFLARMCGQNVAEVTAGCSFGCLYCPYAAPRARRAGVSSPTVVDLSGLESSPAPQSVCLSSASDAFAPQAARVTHALLAHWLPRGTLLVIVTKGIIPERTLDLLAEFHTQIEGVSIGLSSLDDGRNHIVEPGCPSARHRLASIERLANRGLPVALRMNPLFPDLDDSPTALDALIAVAARRGARRTMGAYVFAWGRYLRRLRHEPLLSTSCKLLTEKAPMEGGGIAFSVPFTRKIETYSRIAQLAVTHGVEFNACACQDLRLIGNTLLPTSCRNTSFISGRSMTRPTCTDPFAHRAASAAADCSATAPFAARQ